jgi:hypothetical protein
VEVPECNIICILLVMFVKKKSLIIMLTILIATIKISLLFVYHTVADFKDSSNLCFDHVLVCVCVCVCVRARGRACIENGLH